MPNLPQFQKEEEKRFDEEFAPHGVLKDDPEEGVSSFKSFLKEHDGRLKNHIWSELRKLHSFRKPEEYLRALKDVDNKFEKMRWKRLISYPTYEVSDVGLVRKFSTKREVKPQLSSSGYLQFSLYLNGKRTGNMMVHRAVAEVFVPYTYEYQEVNHIDGNKTNNDWLNLEWCSRSENMQHAVKNGLLTQEHSKKPVVAYMGEDMHIFKSITEGATELGCHIGNVSAVCRGRLKTTGGYYWRFI